MGMPVGLSARAAFIGRKPNKLRGGVLIRGGCHAVEGVAGQTAGRLHDGAAAAYVAFSDGLFEIKVSGSSEQSGQVVGFFFG